MTELSKLLIRYLCPTALIIAKYPWRTYFVFVCLLLLRTRVPEDVALGSFIGAIIPFIWTLLTMQRDEDNAKDAALKNVALQFNELNTYICSLGTFFYFNLFPPRRASSSISILVGSGQNRWYRSTIALQPFPHPDIYSLFVQTKRARCLQG
ncbi:hypothetical protein EDD85DRAFT_1027153 [Armillaria nabsnona]|nr:hypothetical protein EDD85DRAFT_1027153 [Armillaria nabsnona]